MFQVLNAQQAGYDAAIIHNMYSDTLLNMNYSNGKSLHHRKSRAWNELLLNSSPSISHRNHRGRDWNPFGLHQLLRFSGFQKVHHPRTRVRERRVSNWSKTRINQFPQSESDVIFLFFSCLCRTYVILKPEFSFPLTYYLIPFTGVVGMIILVMSVVLVNIFQYFGCCPWTDLLCRPDQFLLWISLWLSRLVFCVV